MGINPRRYCPTVPETVKLDDIGIRVLMVLFERLAAVVYMEPQRQLEKKVNNDPGLEQLLASIHSAVQDHDTKPIDLGKVRSLWAHSKTFKSRWQDSDEKTLNSILFSSHIFKFTREESYSLLFAWMLY